MYRVRVRGIYATALSMILYKRGFILADASEVLKSRVRVPTSDAAPHVTVKSLEENPDEVLILGSPWEAGVWVEEAIAGEVGYYYSRRGRYGIYTVVDAESLGGCRVLLPGGVEARLQAERCPGEGERVRVTIVKEALGRGEEVKARPGASIVGEYVIVSSPGSGISFSEHIRSGELRADLTVKALERIDTRRVHVRFRSSARSGDLEAVIREAVDLAGKVLELASSTPGKPGIVRRGEYISILGLPLPAKERLDGARREVYPTIDMHHSLKAGGDRESMIVDYTEEAVRSGSCTVEAGLDAVYFIASRMGQRGRIYISHMLPHGGALRIGPFTMESVSRSGRCVRLRLSRVFRSPGVLDGLGVEKRPGDKGLTDVDTCSWMTLHTYIDHAGRLLGYYANINTPAEVSLSGIRYTDLYIDVVKKPGEGPRIIDRDHLEEAYASGLISRSLYEEALAWANRAANKLASLG
ncbi:MAG: DUF402 domain-containing protein [Desulfurococcales archaeon]|nr:DUF402 domain-containing protein [Desulfurococcales archaeon]MCE4605648.1 DUF402 domain-containing protein [Desulfurococcales archaeon]